MSNAEFLVGALRAQACLGALPRRRRRHLKPFIGLADVGQLKFCEIQATISQFLSQPGYVEAAFADDRNRGVGVFSRPEMSPEERAKVVQRVKMLTDVDESDPLLRRTAGRLAESLELGGTSTQRRHFDFGPFYVVGCPDAVTATSVVEFGRSRSPRLAVHGKRIQCNLYAVLWEKPTGRLVVVGTDSGERIEETIHPDTVNAERWLNRSWQLLTGVIAPNPPEHRSKCRSCVFNTRRGCRFPLDGKVTSLPEMEGIADRHEA